MIAPFTIDPVYNMKFTSIKESKIAGMLCLAAFASLTFIISLVFFPSHLTSVVTEAIGALMQNLTYSAGHQGFLISLAIFMGLIAWHRRQATNNLHLLIQLGLLLVLSFGAKTFLKEFTQSPRPYTETLAELHVIDSPQSFYNLTVDEKNDRIHQVEEQVSEWRTKHWIGETDYSFPSGHTIFVSVCVLFFGGLFASQGRYVLASLVIVWGVGVAASRLWLGMHRPVDLFASMFFGLILYIIIPSHYPILDKVLFKIKNR